jgi:aminoglycoside phosphotransferase (APT) family kinase protein
MDALLQCGVTTRTALRITDSLLDRAAQLSEREAETSILHGDFKLRHVWASSQGIQVLDFGNSSVGDCCYDIAALMTQIIAQPLWHARGDYSCIDSYCRALLDGYFENRNIPPTLQFYVVELLLRTWCRRLNAWGRNRSLTLLHRACRIGRVARFVDRWYIDRWFESQITRQLSRPWQ